MDRNLNNQIDHSIRTTQPVTFGGTDSQTDIAAAIALTLALESHIGAANGIVPLDADTKIPTEFLSGLFTGNGDTIHILQATAYAGQIADGFAFVTNYDCQRSYIVSLDGGTASIYTRDSIEDLIAQDPENTDWPDPGTISVVFGPTTGVHNLYVNGTAIPITVLEPYIDPPSIVPPMSNGESHWLYADQHLSDSYGFAIAATYPTFTHSWFITPVHLQAQFSYTNTFDSVFYTLTSTSNNSRYVFYNNVPVGTPPFGDVWSWQPFYIRVRYISDTVQGHWSAPVYIFAQAH